MVDTDCIHRIKTKNITQQEKQYIVIIPAAGMGRRIKSYGPKSLMMVNNTPIFKKQIDIIKKVIPNADIVFILGFHNELIKKEIRIYDENVRVIYNPNFEFTNVALSLSLGLDSICKSKIPIIIYGDLLFNTNCIQSIIDDNANNVLLLDEHYMETDEVGVNIDDKSNIISMSYGLPIKWGQMMKLDTKIIREFTELGFKNPKFFSYQIINLLLDNHVRFHGCINSKNRMLEIDNMKNLTFAQEIKWLN